MRRVVVVAAVVLGALATLGFVTLLSTAYFLSFKLDGTTWRVDALNNDRAQVSLGSVTFSDGQVSGDSFCTSFMGSYSADANQATFHDMHVSLSPGCPARIAERGQALPSALSSAKSFGFDSGTLRFTSSSNGELCVRGPECWNVWMTRSSAFNPASDGDVRSDLTQLMAAKDCFFMQSSRRPSRCDRPDTWATTEWEPAVQGAVSVRRFKRSVVLVEKSDTGTIYCIAYGPDEGVRTGEVDAWLAADCTGGWSSA